MRHIANDEFWKRYNELPAQVRRQADKRFALLKQDATHPSLHFKRIGGRWSARVGRGYRALALEIDGGLLWYWIGSHDDYERLLK